MVRCRVDSSVGLYRRGVASIAPGLCQLKSLIRIELAALEQMQNTEEGAE